MKNARNNGQKRVKNCLKWTASGLLLALMFVLVFAGTLSGAFGIENELQQNGIIQSNVASAANTPAGNTEFTSGGHEGMTLNNAATYKYFNVLDNYVLGMYSDNGDPLNYAYWVYYNTGTSQNKNGINIEGGNGKASIRWNITLSGQIYKAFKNGAITTVTFKTTSYSGGNTDPRALSVFSSNAYGSFDSDLTYSNSDIIATTGKKDAGTLEHEVTVDINSGHDNGNSVKFWLELAIRTGWPNNVSTTIHKAWVDFNRVDNERPTITSDDNGLITFEDSLAGIYKIEDNGVDITNDQTINWGDDKKIATYQVMGGKHNFVVTDNVGNSNEYKFNMLETDADGNYLLTSRDDFDFLSAYVAKGNDCAGKSYKIVPDTTIEGQNATTIAMGGTHFTPIGNSTTKFAGTLLGNGCTINGLVTNGQYSGLFGYVNNARIDSLTVNVSNDSGNTSAGGLVGVVNGTTTITNCNVSGAVKGTHQIGGFVGFAQDCVLTISSGTNSATITTTGQSSEDKGRTSGGGIVGYVNANATVTINNVTNTGEVKTTSSNANSGLGGIVGFANGGTNISNCHNTASITGYAGLGGIVGYTARGTIVGCRNDGNITSSKAYDLGAGSASYSGGIAGYCYADVAKCYNSGTVKTTSAWTNSNQVAGIAAYLGSGRNVKYCYNVGQIEGSDYVGGIVGKRAGTVSYSYQAGKIKGLYNKTSTIGHITGSDSSKISTCWTLPSAKNLTTVTNTFNHNGYTVDSEANVAMKPAFGNAVLNGWDAIISTGVTSGTFSEITGIDQFVFYPNNNEHKIENNKYLFVYDTSANAVALVPNHIDSGVSVITDTTTASAAKTVPFVSRVFFNANRNKNIVASISPINAPLTSTQTVYKGATQKVTTDVVGADIQEKSYYFTSGNDNALAKSEVIDAGEYDIVTEVTMKVGEDTYVVVGRQVHETKWTIATRKISFWNKVYYYGETPTNSPVPQSMSGDEGLLNEHTFICTHANDLTYDFMYGAIPNAQKEVTINMTGEIRDAAGNDVTYNYDFQNGTFTISMREGNFGVKGTTDIVNNPWGSQGNPFVIKNAQHLVNLSKIVNGETPANADSSNIVNSVFDSNNYTHVVSNNTRTYTNCYFIIVNDLDMNGSGFAPIGKDATYFFEGNVSGVKSIEDTSQQNRSISNLTVNLASTDNVGLFGYVLKKGTQKPYIKHIVLNNSCSFVGKSNVGSIVGWAQDAVIQNCINNATVEGKGENAGGIVGKNFGTETSNCENHGTVKGVKNVGGIAGTLDWGVISNVQNHNRVEASGENCGGIVGYMISYSTLKNVTNNAQVNGGNKTGGVLGYYEKKATDSVKPIYGLTNNKPVEGLSNVGGIIGCVAGNLTFDGNNESQKCTMSGGSVKGTFNVGGLVGGVEDGSTVTLKNFTNNAKVIGGYVVGGLVGLLRGSITNSVNNADITSEYNKAGTPSGLSIGAYVGGLVGVAYGAISHCYNSGNISASGDNSDFLGGIVGYTNANVAYCTSLENSIISGSNQVGGIVGNLQNATIDYCYFNGKIVGIWNNATAKLDFICGEITGGSVSNSWKLPKANNGDKGNRTYTNAGNALTIATGVTFKPYFVQEGSEHDTEWEQIVSKNIVGFSVSGNVPTNSYFNSDNGNDTAYVKPDKTNGFAANSTSGNVTAWYGADFGRDVRCSIVEIQVDTTPDEYNGKPQGLTREDVYMPSANNGVYAVQFAYRGNKYGDTVPEDVDVYNTTVTVKIDEKVVGVRTGVQYEITKKKVTITNVWTWKFVDGSNADFYKFEYNKDIQGMLSITVDGVLENSHYTLTQTENKAAVGKYSSSVVISDRDYDVEIVSKYCTIQNNNANLKTDNAKYGIKTTQTNANTPDSQTTYTYNWEIVPFDLAANISNVWFGGTKDLIVGNQNTANVKVGNTNKGYYPLQADKKGTPGVQQVLVYAQKNYSEGYFVLYVKYNNGIVAELKQGTDKDYTVGTLDTSNNTVGTFNVDVVSQAEPVKETNVTASGTGNFSGIVTKYYTAMYSDFGWKKDKSPSDEDWGSQDNPYVISTPEHLLRLSQIVNGGMAWNSIQNTVTAGVCIAPQTTAKATSRDYKDAYFLVTADIDMTGNVSTDGVYNFLPIGHRNEQSQTDMPFSGTFDGNGKKIKFEYNVNLNHFYNNTGAHSDYVGLFGYIAGYKVDAEQKYATIKNLSIESKDGNEVGDNGGIIGKDYVGGIAGYAVDSKLYNVSVMYGGWLRGENYVGGIVGYGENTWLEVGNEHDNAITYVNVGGIQYVGGIVGKWIVRSEEQIGGGKDKQEYITTTLGTDVNGAQYVGGLVGWLDTSACTDSVVFAPIVKGSDQNKNVVTGTEYVGALFGVLIGNGYHQSATQGKYTAIVISDQKVNNITLQTNTSAKVVGGLVGYAESVGILFETDWNTSSTTFTLDDSTSFFGGVVGVLGKNSTIEAIIVTKEGDGSYLTGSEHTILNNTALGASGKPIGSFVGGIVGYVSSQAGTYWEANTTIFGNGISLVNSGQIHATGYAGGIFGALGDLSTSVAQTFENDTDSILYKVLTTGVRSGNANTTLGIAPTVASAYFTGAKGKLVNNASLSVTDGYVGGIAGYSGAKVRFVLRNTPQTGAIATENLNVYSGGNDIYINGSYAGGIAGYLVDNLEHELKYIVVQAKFDSANATRVGGLVGYMGSGKVENCVVTNGGNSNVNESTDTFKGSEYVGGLVGETQNAIIANSVSTGFNLEKTTNTKGGLLGGGTNPTIESSWTFYIAQSKVAEEPGVAENKKKYKTTYPTYSTVSKNTYGEYVLVDNRLYKDVTFADLCKFAGITQSATAGILEFSVDVPGANKTGSLKNKQLAFYDASGNDTETSNQESFKGFDNSNNVLTIKLDMASGTSMQICVVDIEFVNIPQHDTDNDEAAHAVVESTYKKPSNSTRYHVDVTQANFDIANTKQVTYIKANVYFECNGTLTVISDGVYLDLRKVGDYDSGTLTPGSQENPLTISNQKEWNDFAYSVYTGTDYTNKYVKLLTNDIVINTGNNGSGMHEGTKGSHNFGSVQAIPSAGQNAPLTDANGNAVDRNNIGYNFAGDISHDGNVNNFHGTFDGNGHYITVNYGSGGFYRVSVFPNAAGATFRNLTIKGYIQAASQMTGANGIANSAAYDVAGFVGKPFGTLNFYNCTNEADIIGLRNVAGLVGYNAGGQSITLEACVNTGDITSLEGSYTLGGINKKTYSYDDGWNNQGYGYGTGGIIGSYTGTLKIESCRNAGTIIGGHNVGGIIGLHNGTSNAVVTIEINNCANTGNITSNSGYWNEDEGGIEGSTSTGVRQNIFGYAGGIVGKTGQYSILKMYASYNTGTILTLSNMSGGLAGGVGSFYFKSAGPMNAIQTGGRSEIVYCYNTGDVYAGGTFPKITSAITDFIFGSERENIGGTISGGFVGCAGNIQISQGYNAGNIWNFGHISYDKSWQIRAAGIVGQSEPVTESNQTGYVLLDNLYNVGTLSIRPIDYSVITGHTVKNNMRYGAAISGYIDKSDRNTRVKAVDCYSINNCISSRCAVLNGKDYKYYKNGLNSWNPEYRDQWYQNSGVGGIGSTQVDLIETGRVYSTYDALTAAMDENSRLRMTGTNFAFGQSTTALSINYGNVNNYTYLLEQIIANDGSISESSVSNLSSIQWKNFPDSWLYVYGCLPQLSVFALDTQNGLSMRSVGYGKNDYGEYNENGLPAGSEQYPYIIKDGVDLMGMQALVDAGYSFEGKYIEVADGTNTLDKLASKQIKLATYNSTDTAAVNDASNTMYKAVDQKGAYRVGKSYHLLLQGAVFNKAYNKGENPTFVGSDYSNWAWNTYYYNGGYRDNEWTDSGINPNKFYNYGGMRQLGIFALQNFIPMGRGSSVFKGHFSGKQANGENTTIDDVRITTGKYGTTTEYGSEYGGLFAKVQDAYIGYISIGGSSTIWSFTKENDISACGGIVGLALGDTVIDNCGIEDTAEIGSYGVSKTNEYVILDNGKIVGSITNGNFAKATYAGGIVGMADPKQGNTYNAGITTTIRNCSISSSGRIESAKSNIGGVLGYVGGDAGANGKGNSVRIEKCFVQKAAIQAASSATESSHIGGVLGYGSEYVAAFITGCSVGNGADTVTIKGEHSLGGIAGGMSNAKGGYIDSCIVGEKATIERINQGGGNISENPKHGTAIGGLVGFTEDSTDTTSPLTTTFSGTSKFLGTINVTVGTTNPGEHGDKKPVGNVGGIVGDMGSGANFASGSNVTVGGTINITLEAANVGGVAGRTSNATFIGKFEVRPTMNTTEAENVGGFIGKNVGTVYILADNTERIVDGKLNGTNITIGGTIRGTHEVGGFIGVNNSGSSLNIGSNVANAKPYKSGTLSITIAEGAQIIGSGNHVGGIVGKNEGAVDSAQNDYATIDIVKGTIVQNGAISGKNYVGGIIGLNAGLLTTGGGEADTSIGGIALSPEQIKSIKNLSITNGNVNGDTTENNQDVGNVKGGVIENNQDVGGDCVGGVIGWLDAPQTLRDEHKGKGDIAGVFTNSGSVEGNRFVGGSLGYVGKYVKIATKGGVNTLFVNTGNVTAHSTFVGGSIGAIVGQITGAKVGTTVNFESQGTVNGLGYVGGSIGVLAGQTQFAQFVNSSKKDFTIDACNSVGGSVGYIGMPDALKTILNTYFNDNTYSNGDITVKNVHFEASGNLTANPSDDTVNAAKSGVADNDWGGVGGAIGVLGRNQLATWENNTYYANGNVIAQNVNNVGGIVGLINANDITIGNLLAYNIIVTGAKNVGGIVGATNGTNTKILSAYAIEGTFSGTENVGGIIGLANSTEGVATDAKTSYWVKGYSNAVLAGADVKDLQQTIGKFETIVEQVTVDGKQQSIVFTEDFCKLYTPKTYYVDYPGTHTYNGKTITLGENNEQLTWDSYFKDKLGETSAQTKNGAWVKPVANAVTFSTGTEKTGWYFAFANDANDATGANGLGIINTNHHKDGGDYELKYWKRIANAYTAQERADKEDKKTLDPPSDIVSGGQPQHATLYATATAAGEDSGYYLYMATSGASRPTATYASNKFFIQVLTTTTTRADLAKNVAIYYRTISKGKTLTYNGYLRYAPVGITVDDGKTVPYVQTPQQDATKKDSYCYSADTTTGGNATGGAQIDPGNYESAVKIYYYDKDGKPYIVGGVSIKWEIKARQLSADIKSDPHRVYGDNRNQDDGHDMKVVISNIAPGAGTPPQFVITVTDKSSNPNVVTTFIYNGNALNDTQNGITVTAASIGDASNNGWEASDNLYNVNEPTDITTKDVLFYIDFTNAKTYEVSVAMEQGDWTKRYTLDANKDFIVNPAPLDLTRSNPASEKYDGTAKSATWFISGFKYQDGAKEFAAFQPQFKTALGKTTDPKVVTLYNLYKGTATSGYTLETNITLGRPGETVSYGEKVENQSKTISYTLSGATQAGDYSIVFPSTGSSITVGNYTLKFYEGASPQTKPPVFSIAENKITISISYVDSTKQHPYNGQKKGKITITFEADNEIAGYGDYISNFFNVSINNDGKEISKPSGTTSGKTAQWVFETGVDAKEYKVTISDGVNHTEYVKNCAHDAYPNNIIYKITKAPLTVEFVQTDPTKTTYEYNTYHQGLKKVKLSGLWQNANNNSNMYDSVDITVNFDNKAYSVTIDHNDSAVDIKGIDTRNVGNYTATISNSVGGTRGSNYYISNSSVSTSWKITPHELKLGGLEQDGTKIYDGAAVTPKLTVGGNNVTNGQTTYNEDTIQIKYSATLNKVTAKAIVNAGVYKISIGGSSATDAIKATRDGEDTTKNYTISGTDSATYTISKRPITVTWNMSTLKFVYDLAPHGLTVSGITGGGEGATLQSSSLDTAIVKTGYGNDVIKFTLQGKKVDAGKEYEMSIKSSALNGRIVNDEVESTIDNYVISGTTCEKKFEIEKSQIIIKYAGGTTSKVYDATTTVKDNNFTFTVSSTNFGANGTSTLFTISYVYTDKNVGDNKDVAFTYDFKQNANYEYVGTGSESKNVGQITPAHIKVALDKLRSGKATRTFTNNEWYGGQAGASGGEKDGKSTVYRSGEGFRISGVFGNDDIKVVAKYAEAGDDRAMFDKYVNDIVKIDENTFAKAAAGTHLKMLVFEMTGDDAKNYTFNVYNKLGTDGKKYSEKDSTAGDKQTVTVYDTDDKANGHQNANGAEQIQIEITVKSVRVDYGNAYQSYAKADNTYNTDWQPITATSKDITAADGTIDVVNNWMYEDNDPTKPKREYHGYTTIRGSEKSTVLGATISKDKGMNFNFRLINQPVLTIAYIVENNGTYEIDTLARLLIASFYYTAHQNPGDQIFMQIVQSGYKWFKVVEGEDYSQVDFAPDLENSPITVDETIKTWDAYINALNEAGYAVFYNETEKAWGCYVSDSSQPTALPTSYKLTKDISGKFTADDIKVLDAFFTVTTADDNGQFTTKKYTWSGANSDYLKNVLSASVDKVATIDGSLFVSQKAEGAAAITGFDGTFDGNGYVIEYLNIMGYGKENVGLFDIIGANGSVKNLHLRNITINANQGNVGGIAGSIAAAEGEGDATKNVTNVSFHGKITATGGTVGGTVGGLFGTSARAIDGAIVLGEISASGANVGGVVGTATADLTKVVSMMQITANGGTVGAFTSTQNPTISDSFHMTNAVWKSGTSFVNVEGKNIGYNDLMSGSNSLYANAASDSGTYDVINETFADSGQNVNPRQSKRLRDMVSVYLLMYSLKVNGDKYTISASSWLVGTADGTNAKPIVIANKQNVSLLRELRFAAFVLKANVSIDIASTFSGAFYGIVTSENGKDYKITCNKQMFEAYATATEAWLIAPTKP